MSNKWTQAEEEYLAANLGSDVEAVATALGRPPRSVRARMKRMREQQATMPITKAAKILGVRVRHLTTAIADAWGDVPDRLSPSDLDRIRGDADIRIYTVAHVADISGLTSQGVYQRIRREFPEIRARQDTMQRTLLSWNEVLAVANWTPAPRRPGADKRAEAAYNMRMAGDTYESIGAVLGVTHASARALTKTYARKIGEEAPTQIRRAWTEHEDQFLRDFWRTMPDDQIAMALGRTEWSVWFRRRTLGLKKPSRWGEGTA